VTRRFRTEIGSAAGLGGYQGVHQMFSLLTFSLSSAGARQILLPLRRVEPEYGKCPFFAEPWFTSGRVPPPACTVLPVRCEVRNLRTSHSCLSPHYHPSFSASMPRLSLKTSLLSNDPSVLSEMAVNFDADLPQYQTKGGVRYGPEGSGEVLSPVLMVVEALDLLFERITEANWKVGNVRGIFAAGQVSLVPLARADGSNTPWYTGRNHPRPSSPHSTLANPCPRSLKELPELARFFHYGRMSSHRSGFREP